MYNEKDAKEMKTNDKEKGRKEKKIKQSKGYRMKEKR